MSMRIVQMSSGAGTAHSDSTVEASLARKTFAAGELLPSKAYFFEAVCRVTASQSTDTVVMGVRFGTSGTVTSNTAIATSSAVDAADGDICVIRGRIYVQSATRYVFSVQMNDCDANGQAAESYASIFTAVADTAYNLDITADWSVASASNSIQCENLTIFECV